MKVYVLLYTSGEDNEGIHSIELKGKTVILMFEDSDDADRYCGLLQAQDFPTPKVELLDKLEVEKFCDESGYDARYVKKGFVPKTDEERLLIAPPEANLDVSLWNQETKDNESLDPESTSQEIETMRKRLEDLI